MLRRNTPLNDTIFALASGSLPSAVAIEKLSGPRSFEIFSRLFKSASSEPEIRRGMYFGTLSDLNGNLIDEGLALVFVSPHSHTGEDSVEFHLHGSLSVVQKLEATLLQLGARPAERGEFTYRAHLNGKLSSTDVERLGDVFLARDPADLARIYDRKEESLAQVLSKLRTSLLSIQAVLDTSVDFSEEYSSVLSLVEPRLAQAIHECSAAIHRYQHFKAGSKVPRLVLAGLPNAGKSSLFNALLGRYRAIVHEEAGTTRDVIEEDIEVQGRRWKLVDTAGIRESQEVRERTGIELGERYLSAADFWILVVDGTQGISREETTLLDKHGTRPHFIVWNKQDLPGWSAPGESWFSPKTVELSALDGRGLDKLWAGLEDRLFNAQDHGPLPTAVQSARLSRVLVELEDLKSELAKGIGPEFLAEKNRIALLQLEAVTGEVTTDDVLDRVFGEFCIGK